MPLTEAVLPQGALIAATGNLRVVAVFMTKLKFSVLSIILELLCKKMAVNIHKLIMLEI